MKFLVFAAAAGLAFAQAGGDIIPLWEKDAPGYGDAGQPTLSVLRAAVRQNGSRAVIVAPDGRYTNLAMDKEGRQAASWAMGVTAFVLKRRLGPHYHHPIELGDAQRDVRLVCSRAASLGVTADRIGMMGFSAGGFLATAATHFGEGNAGAPDPVDQVSSRRDFLIPAYPVLSFDPAIAHPGSVRSLLGDNPSPELLGAWPTLVRNWLRTRGLL